MRTRKEVIDFCLRFEDVFEDYPFDDTNWTLIRQKKNRKAFAWIFERKGLIWVNVKCTPEMLDFWRQVYPSVQPAYHMNKDHWNSIILDGSIPDDEIYTMIKSSYELTKN